ncbi:hypothetical protein GN956_G19179 [Arapaima gigas]
MTTTVDNDDCKRIAVGAAEGEKKFTRSALKWDVSPPKSVKARERKIVPTEDPRRRAFERPLPSLPSSPCQQSPLQSKPRPLG